MIPFLIPAVIIVLIIIVAALVWYFKSRKVTYEVMATSAGWRAGESSVLIAPEGATDATLIKATAVSKRGLTLSKITRGGIVEVIGHYDTHNDEASSNQFVAALDAVMKEKVPFIVTAYDEFTNKGKTARAALAAIGSTQVSKAAYRGPFIFIMDADGKILADQVGAAEKAIYSAVKIAV